MTKKAKSNDREFLEEPTDICPKCGSKMTLEEGVMVCPHCDGEIDYFGDDDE